MSSSNSARRLWGAPIVLGVLTATGLLTALVSDSWGDGWSWVGLGLPVIVRALYGLRRPLTARGEAGSKLNPSPSSRN